MEYKKYLAVDQYGNKVFISAHPRKELCERHGVKHADKIYRDGPDEQAIHIGYIVAGHWYEVLRISPFKES